MNVIRILKLNMIKYIAVVVAYISDGVRFMLKVTSLSKHDTGVNFRSRKFWWFKFEGTLAWIKLLCPQAPSENVDNALLKYKSSWLLW